MVGEISELHVCQQFDKVVSGKEAKNFFSDARQELISICPY